MNSIGSQSIRYAATAALTLLALFLLVETLATLQGIFNYTNPSPHTITVSGEGTATAIPDTATISFGATATAADVATAQSQVTGIINNALAGVKASGISDQDVTTDSFNVSPHYNTPVCPPGIMCPNTDSQITGYDVSENVTVKIHDTTKVSDVLAVLTKANVTNVSGPDFVVDDTQTVIEQARAQAIQKAQADAQSLASQLGVRLGKVVSYSDSDSGSSPQPMFKADALAAPVAAAAPTVPMGQNTYTEDVSVTYEIN